MKKIFSFITALLFAGSMFADVVTFTKEDFAGQGTANTGSEVTATKGGVTFMFDKGYCASESLRCYAHGSLSITATSTIEKINFTTTGGKTGGLDPEVTVNATSYTIEDLASQARFTEIAVTLAEGGEDPGDEPAENVLTGELSGVDATYSFTYEFATTEDMQLEVTGLLEITGEVVGMVPQIFINNAYAGNFTYDAGVCSFTSADAYEAGAELDIYFYFAYAGGATATDHVSYTIEAQGGDEPEPVAYYIKSKWAEDATDWTWQPMTEESEGVWVYDGTFYGTGVNINTKADDNGAVWYPLGEAYEGHQLDGEIEAGQNVHFVYNVEAATVTATAIVEPEITTCAQAAEAALSVSDNNVEYNNGAEYTIEGYVTAIQTAFSERFSNISFWMADTKDGGNVLEAYRAACASADDAPAVGDKVAVTGKLTKYNETPEFAAGCTFVILEKGEVIPEEPAQNLGQKTIAEFLELKNLKDTCILTGVVSNIVNDTYGNFDLTDETGTVYVYGLLTPAGESKKFADLNVAENDTLTILAIYNEYNSNPQAKNAIFVEVKKYVEPVVFSHELYGSEELPAIGKTWFANTGWTEETNSHAEIVNDYDVNIVLVDAKAGQWQSQIFVNPGFTWEVGAYYKMEFDLTTNHQLGGVTVKVNNNDNNVFYYSYPNDNIFLADQTTHFVADSIYAMAEPTDGGQLIFSVGWCDANTEILISNIVITKYEAPVVPLDIEITVSSLTNPGALIWTDATATDGWWQIYGRIAQYGFSLSNVGGVTEAAGTYTVDDLDADYCYVNIYGATDTVKVAFVDGSITIAVADGIVTVNATLVGDDGNSYIFNLTYKDPTAENTVNLVMPDWQLDDTYLEEAGLFGLVSESADGNYVQLYIWSETVAGDYTDADLDNQYFGSGLVVGEEAPAIFSATIKVEEGANGAITVTADLLCYNNTLYKVTTQVPVTALENIELVEKATKVVSDGQVLIIRDAKMFNVLGARIR